MSPSQETEQGMYSAPAAIRTPAMLAIPMPSPDMQQQEAYPWAVHTPEGSPRCWQKTPLDAVDNLAVAADFNGDVLKDACAPFLEQMCRSLGSNAFMHQMAAEGKVSQELLRNMCEPFFEQMLASVQASLQHQGQDIGKCPQSAHWSYQPAAATSFYGCEEESTEAEGASSPFASLLSNTSSDVDALDAIERKSVTSEATADSDKSHMVCRHWKTKGWCRLESGCKFLHPEHKRGIAAPTDMPLMSESQVRRRKRGGKNRSGKAPPAQLGSLQQLAIEA